MEIRHYSELEKFFAGTHPIREAAPEVRFIRALCAGDGAAVTALFRERKLFGGALPAVDTPYGRFEGLEEIGRFAREWNGAFGAVASFPVPCIHTEAGGRAALEVSVNFTVDGAVDQVPMFVIADRRTPDTLDEVRIYCHFSFIPGCTPYRRPIFPAERLQPGDPGLLTGAVREYYEALHTYPAADVDRILGAMGPRVIMGGYHWYDPARYPDGFARSRAQLAESFGHMRTYIPAGVAMRYETVIDDGRTGVLEWVHVLSQKGARELGRIAMSGIAAYERGEDGYLCSVRILDYAWQEKNIDWTKASLTEAEARALNVKEE